MKRWIIIVMFVVILMMPPFIHGYIYPSVGDDAGYHMAFIESIMNGQNPFTNPDLAYNAQIVFGFPLAWISQIFGVAGTYLWFSYMALLGVCLIIYYVVSRHIGSVAGILAMIAPVFIVGGLLHQWFAGTIYNIINVGIILLGTHCALLWMERKRKWVKVAIAGGLYAVAFILHPSGYYVVIMFVGLGIAYLIAERTDIRLAIVLFMAFGGIFVSSFTSISPDPYRQVLDSSTMFALLVSSIIGILLNKYKVRKVFQGIGVIVIIAVMVLPVHHWLTVYSSAVRPVDKLAIDYINELPGEYYSVSPEIAPWIYDRYVNKQYMEGELPYIVRSEPMTMKTMPESDYYWWDNGVQVVVLPLEYDMERIRDNGIEIDVYY